MKKLWLLLYLLVSLGKLSTARSDAYTTSPQLPVEQRMAKARAAKAQKKQNRAMGKSSGQNTNPEKAMPTDYKAPVDKVLKGPNGEVVHTGERGAKFYINKNGNKTYLSSNQ